MDRHSEIAARPILSDHDPVWVRHSGRGGHRDHPEWVAGSDGALARTFYESVEGKAKVFLDLLIDNAGRQLSADDICEAVPEVFTGPASIAGAINGLHRPFTASGRRYPFYWWAERPTRYAMKHGVGTLFQLVRTGRAA